MTTTTAFPLQPPSDQIVKIERRHDDGSKNEEKEKWLKKNSRWGARKERSANGEMFSVRESTTQKIKKRSKHRTRREGGRNNSHAKDGRMEEAKNHCCVFVLGKKGLISTT